MRADARRNHARLLRAARALLAEQGTRASLEEVARRAGLGVGTLYRHFPTREALLAALLEEHFAALTARADALREAADPVAALVEWLRVLVEGCTAYRGLAADLVATLRDESSALRAVGVAMSEAGGALLERAREAGGVGPGCDARDLLTLACGLAWAAEQAGRPARTDRLVALAVRGLVAAPPGADAGGGAGPDAGGGAEARAAGGASRGGGTGEGDAGRRPGAG